MGCGGARLEATWTTAADLVERQRLAMAKAAEARRTVLEKCRRGALAAQSLLEEEEAAQRAAEIAEAAALPMAERSLAAEAQRAAAELEAGSQAAGGAAGRAWQPDLP